MGKEERVKRTRGGGSEVRGIMYTPLPNHQCSHCQGEPVPVSDTNAGHAQPFFRTNNKGNICVCVCMRDFVHKCACACFNLLMHNSGSI